MSDRSITLIGAGPVGSLLALFLARRGFEVQVFERRPDLRAHAISAGRSINVAVSTRGLHALHEVGLDDEVLRLSVPMHGRMLHALDGAQSFWRYGRDDSEFINSMGRGELNKILMTRAEAAGARIHFEQRLMGYDFAARRARLRDERDGSERQVDAPVCIGTDGSASALRDAMQSEGDLTFTRELLDFGYKELTMPPASGGPHGMFSLAPNALHIWPRGRYMLIALPNTDGSFTCTLFLSFESDRRAAGAPERGPLGGSSSSADEPSFARLQTAAEVSSFFAAQFADAVPLLGALERQFLDAPLGQMVTIKAAPWSRGATLLLGDAAHAIVPFFGQGMNAGFEDCALFDRALPRDPDWPALFDSFWRARKGDTDAIADLAVENFVEMRDKVADREFQLHKAVESELQRRIGARYVSRYQLVTFSRVPYREALRAGQIQLALLRELCAGKARPDEIDYDLAARLVDERLGALFASIAKQ